MSVQEVRVRALFDFVALDDDQLSFNADDVFEVVGPAYGEGWVSAFHNGKVGAVPAAYVESWTAECEDNTVDLGSSGLSLKNWLKEELHTCTFTEAEVFGMQFADTANATVTSLTPGGQAECHGVLIGMVLVRVQGEEVPREQIVDLLISRAKERPFEVEFKKQGGSRKKSGVTFLERLSEKVPLNPLESFEAALPSDFPVRPTTLYAPLWREYAAKQHGVDVSTLDKDTLTRMEVLYEIVRSEDDHVYDLRVVVELYRDPFLKCAPDVISAGEVYMMFDQLDSLLACHTSFLDTLKGALEASVYLEDVPACFLAWIEAEDQMGLEGRSVEKHYVAFCESHGSSLALVEKKLKSSTEFALALDYVERLPASSRLPLKSYLHKPVARICKYPLLLKTALKNTPSDDPSRAALLASCSHMERLVEVVNEVRRQMDNLQDIREVLASISGTESLSLAESGRTLKKQGVLTKYMDKGKRQDRHFFLFNDVVLWAKKSTLVYPGKRPYDLRQAFPLAGMEVETSVVDCPEPGGAFNNNNINSGNNDSHCCLGVACLCDYSSEREAIHPLWGSLVGAAVPRWSQEPEGHRPDDHAEALGSLPLRLHHCCSPCSGGCAPCCPREQAQAGQLVYLRNKRWQDREARKEQEHPSNV